MKKLIYLGLVVILVVLIGSIMFKGRYKEDNEKEVKGEYEQGSSTSTRANKGEDNREDESNLSQNEREKDTYIRYDSQGSIGAGILFLNLVEENKENLTFELMLNTHSVNLDDIDYANLVSLTTDKEIVISDGFRWEKTEGGGHHISGYLEIPRKYEGTNIIDDSTKFIEIEIRGLDNIESRKFRWEQDVLKFFNY
ncbi:hypothetical protein GOQ27_04720 [Clostridium sp. D2Q-11]|uniref:Uncharacterized protein n=1 Tax=Anaeromonas frigoriresistens TaxID=2683708 RepID=A0A942V0D4_9FIRM|nr:hypothetical protein [Anaeromonas frigoriresistens]MBS4537752.1 hypothetical protein [Anaeromonas frigoriresistens]